MSTDRSIGPFNLYFVGVGPQRTGTSWLHKLLEYHPALCFPRRVDEPMFFDLYYENGFARYFAHFKHREEGQLCGEISPTYFDVEVSPARIHQVNPECRIIINLRNPISRAFSLYRHHSSRGRVRGAFSDAVLQMPRILSSGEYAIHIPRWLDMFGENQVAFVLLEDIGSKPATTLKRIYEFLGVAPITMPSIGNERINSLAMPRFRRLAKIAARVVTYMDAHAQHNAVELGKMLGLNKLIYSGGEREMSGLTQSDQLQLLEKYETDIAYVEDLLARDLSTWRQIDARAE